MPYAHILLLFNAAVTFYTLGVIWFAQRVVYPLFAKIGDGEYRDYHLFYAKRIPLPVIVPGFLTLLAPIAMLFLLPGSVPFWLAVANATLGIVGTVLTLVFLIPRHNKLETQGKQHKVLEELVRYNGFRTFLITGQAVFSALIVIAAFSPR